MIKAIKGLGVAALVTFGTVSMAQAMDAKMMMEGYAACNQQYNACMTGGTNMSLASDPASGMAQLQANSQNAVSCASGLQACYASVK